MESLVPTLHIASVYSLLSEYPGAKQISEVHLTKLANLLATASKGHYRKDKAVQIRDAARTSVGSVMPAKSLELKHTIKLIRELTSEIDEIEDSIQQIMDELHPPILSIPGMGVHSAAMILAEIGDFSNFESPDKILAYAGCSPSTYQSGKLTNCYAHMEKRGSRYLRYALYNATKYVCHWNPVFAEYLAKKRAEGKHYNVALSHATKKLVRLIYALQKSGKAYLTAVWFSPEPKLKPRTTQLAQQTLDKPKHSNAILFLRGLAGLALLFSPSPSLFQDQHLNAVCHGERMVRGFFILGLDF